MKSLKAALREAGTNVMIANMTSVPLNYLMLSIMIPLEWSPLAITVVTTLVFTAVALIRFVSIRLYFERKAQC